MAENAKHAVQKNGCTARRAGASSREGLGAGRTGALRAEVRGVPRLVPNRDRGVAFLPLVPVRLKSLKPERVLPEQARFGRHIRHRRLELGLSQNELNRRLRVDEKTIRNWENHHTKPLATSVSKIKMFLGYDPLAEEKFSSLCKEVIA